MRYILIAVAIGLTLLLAWGGNYQLIGGMKGLLALGAGLSAMGLIKRQAWGAQLLSAVALVIALIIVGLMVVIIRDPNYVANQPGGWGWLVLFGVLGAAVMVGVKALALERDLRRERAAPE
jgi:hypothetical protein